MLQQARLQMAEMVSPVQISMVETSWGLEDWTAASVQGREQYYSRNRDTGTGLGGSFRPFSQLTPLSGVAVLARQSTPGGCKEMSSILADQ